VLSFTVLSLLSPALLCAQTGKKDFQDFCAQCHGIDGKGDKVEDLQGPDLTHLSETHGGIFPSQEVYEVIDGRKKRPEHKLLLEMPLWGEYFQQKDLPKDAAERKTQSRITALVRYIQSFQEN
jgi:mono/diheme cytochrome c family protein